MALQFIFQRRVVRSVVRRKMSFADGMAWTLKEATQPGPGADLWRKCIPHLPLLDPLPARWRSWFNDLTSHVPPPDPTGLLWFEFPNELNPAWTSVSGYSTLDRDAEDFGLEVPRTWPISADGDTLPQGLMELPELDEFLHASGWRDKRFDANQEELQSGFYALSNAAITLLVYNEFPHTEFARSSSGPIGVVAGWAAGDVSPIGTFKAGKWSRLVRRPSRSLAAEQLDPNSYRFKLEKYLAAGGDPNAKVPAPYGALLHKYTYGTPREVKLLLEAGADPKIPDAYGNPTLLRFGAAEFEILDALIAHGADPTEKDRFGRTLLDRMLEDGRCTLEHIQWCLKHEARFLDSADFRPLHMIGGSGCHYKERLKDLAKMAQHFVEQKFDINAIDADGHTPLTLAISKHAQEIDDFAKFRKENPDITGHWDYKRDAVAAMLLSFGADPNVRLPKVKSRRVPVGGTPLMVRRYDTTELVSALLKHGADPTLTCDKGKSALDYAKAAAKRPDELGNEAAQAVVDVLGRAVRTWTKSRGSP